MLAPSDDPHGTRATALWSRDGGALLAFNEPFAAFFDFSTARLRDSTNMRWTQLGCGSFIYEDTRARVEESVWRLHCAVDLLNMGIQTDVLEPDVHLVSAAGRLKVCDIRLMRFVRNELAEPAIAWVISTLSERLPPPSPPVRPPVLAFDAAPAPAPGDGAPQPRGAGIVVKFPWKHLRPERKPRKEPRRRPRRFSALDLNYAHAYTGPCAPAAATTAVPAPAAPASPAPSE